MLSTLHFENQYLNHDILYQKIFHLFDLQNLNLSFQYLKDNLKIILKYILTYYN